MIRLVEFFSYIDQYSSQHPFKMLRDRYFNRKCQPVYGNNPLNLMMAMNYINQLRQALDLLKSVNGKAYYDFMSHKLKAKDSNSLLGYNLHNLLSSLCELSVMYSFILSSNQKESFVYENKLRDDNKMDVDFSISINNIQYNVEIKSGNLIKVQKQIDERIKNQGIATIADVRLLDSDSRTRFQMLDSLDNKIKDFLINSNSKFPDFQHSTNTINLLYVCWNEHIDQVFTALKYRQSGLLTPNSFYRSETSGKAVCFNNITHILVSDLYRTMMDFLQGCYTNAPFSPFNLSLSDNWLIDYNLNEWQVEIDRYKDILRTDCLAVVDEEYASTRCNEIRFIFPMQ